MTSEETFQVCGRKRNTETTCDQFVNNIIVRDISRKHPELERQILQTHKEIIEMGKPISNQTHITRPSNNKQVCVIGV